MNYKIRKALPEDIFELPIPELESAALFKEYKLEDYVFTDTTTFKEARKQVCCRMNAVL